MERLKRSREWLCQRWLSRKMWEAKLQCQPVGQAPEQMRETKWKLFFFGDTLRVTLWDLLGERTGVSTSFMG